MKILKKIPAIVFSFLFLQVNAQNEIPAGFGKGRLVLSDSSVLTGYIKDNTKKDASVVFLNEMGKKKKYTGEELISAEVDSNRFSCFNGDFFKIVCKGEICFLQKSSDASGKPVYNGTEAFFINGTPGKPGDYFIFNNRNKALKLVSKNTFASVTASTFTGCAAAMEKVNEVQGDIARLGEAVEIYNSLAGK